VPEKLAVAVLVWPWNSIIHPRTGKEVWPRRERVWAFGREEYERHIAEGLLWWGKTGNYSFPKLILLRDAFMSF
jgi:adenine-specific DNA-methyltransferase